VQSAKLAAIGELAASVAHEINNPLTVILGNSGLLLQQLPSDSPAHRKVEAIEAEAMRAGRIVRDLLNFARRREPRREPVSLHELLERAVELLGPKLNAGHVEVERVFDFSLPMIAADRDQLTQVFLNLITNAADAMASGGRLILQTAIHHGDDGRRMVNASVSDTGNGMPPEHLARIFEPFYTTKGEGHGTGLGLSVSLGIVQAHGGAIDVESKPGHGTTVRVKLPVY
jgi:two-component system NtrC family sensor kinase